VAGDCGRGGKHTQLGYAEGDGSDAVSASEPAFDVVLYVSVVRTEMDPMSLEPEARSIVTSMDRDIPVTDVHAMQDLIGMQLAQPRFAMVLLGAFAGLALVLTVVGLYG